MHPLLREVDWERKEDEAVELLRALVRFDTSNPPGDEAECVEFLAQQVREAGLQPEVLSPAPRRANLVVRLPASGGRDLPPLLLNGHVDVVGAEEGRWRHPPFAGEVHDGAIWGRGTVDMKQMVAMSVVVVRLLAELGAPLRRDLLLAAVADEEAGCAMGSAFLVDQHPDKVKAGFALGEVGGFTLHLGRRPVYLVQVAEKGSLWVRARTRGSTGHGSLPRADNAVVRLGEAVARAATRLPLHPSAEVRRFVEALAAAQRHPARDVLPLLLRPRWSNLVLDRLVRDPAAVRGLNAVLRNTVTPTVLRAGFKTNVIPGEAEAELDGRIAIGSTEEELLAQLRALVGPEVGLEVVRSSPPTVASPDTELFGLLAEVVAEHHPGAVAVPSVTPGFTDAKYWSQLGTTCYGFSPLRLEPSDAVFADLFHGDDERIPVAGFRAGLRMLADAVARFCLAPTAATA
jgi:acetylornithine deacetylase/succinyl-diaminopimelate desuccinylase-like protein